MKLKHLLYEFEEETNPYHDPKQDLSVAKYDDTRKTRLTLAHINHLRKLNDVDAMEYHMNIKKIKNQYGLPKEEEGRPGF